MWPLSGNQSILLKSLGFFLLGWAVCRQPGFLCASQAFIVAPKLLVLCRKSMCTWTGSGTVLGCRRWLVQNCCQIWNRTARHKEAGAASRSWDCPAYAALSSNENWDHEEMLCLLPWIPYKASASSFALSLCVSCGWYSAHKFKEVCAWFSKIIWYYLYCTRSGENLKLTKWIMSTQKPPIKGLVLMSPCLFKNCRRLNSVHFMKSGASYTKELMYAQAAMEHSSLK